MVEPLEISSEDDLLAHLMKKHELGQFAKVTRISTLPISPEIDLLNINEREKIVTGYELKLLKYNKRLKRVNFNLLYSGIGQALLYYQHGVHRSYLVLGLSPSLPDNSVASTIVKIEETTSLFRILRNIPTGYRYPRRQEISVSTYGFDCLGIMLWTPNNDLLETKLEVGRNYLPLEYVEDLKHKNSCLLRKEFKCDKKFLEKQKRKRLSHKVYPNNPVHE